MGESLRWEVFGTLDGEFRPDLAAYDDLDVGKSVTNKKMIDKNWFTFENEIQGSLSRDCQQIFLWNVIKKDGLVPRIVKKVSELNSWRHFWVPIEINGEPTWDAYTKEDLNTLQYEEWWPSSYKQNGLLQPHVEGDTMIPREIIQWINADEVPSNIDRTCMGNDTASSLKEKSDSFASVVTSVKIIDGLEYYYVLDSKAFRWEKKRQWFVVGYNKNLCEMYDVVCINIENKQGAAWLAQKYDEEGLTNNLINAKGDKWNRLKRFEKAFFSKRVFFVKNSWNKQTVEQLVDFTGADGNDDDLVDGLVFSMRPTEYWEIA